MMEPEDALAKAVRADVETRAVVRKRVLPDWPSSGRRECGRRKDTPIGIRSGRLKMSLPIIEDGLEQPGQLCNVRLDQE
jgi:hypothetical protein